MAKTDENLHYTGARKLSEEELDALDQIDVQIENEQIRMETFVRHAGQNLGKRHRLGIKNTHMKKEEEKNKGFSIGRGEI